MHVRYKDDHAGLYLGWLLCMMWWVSCATLIVYSKFSFPWQLKSSFPFILFLSFSCKLYLECWVESVSDSEMSILQVLVCKTCNIGGNFLLCLSSNCHWNVLSLFLTCLALLDHLSYGFGMCLNAEKSVFAWETGGHANHNKKWAHLQVLHMNMTPQNSV